MYVLIFQAISNESKEEINNLKNKSQHKNDEVCCIFGLFACHRNTPFNTVKRLYNLHHWVWLNHLS